MSYLAELLTDKNPEEVVNFLYKNGFIPASCISHAEIYGSYILHLKKKKPRFAALDTALDYNVSLRTVYYIIGKFKGL